MRFTNLATLSYSQAAVLFTTGSSSTVAAVYCWKNTGGSGVGYCDDLAVEALPSATNALTNPGFETGALTPWTQSTGTASSVVASNSRTGTYALQTGVGSSGAIQTAGGLVSSGTYLLAGWAEVATAGEEVAIGVKSFGGAETYLRPRRRPTPSSPSSLHDGRLHHVGRRLLLQELRLRGRLLRRLHPDQAALTATDSTGGTLQQRWAGRHDRPAHRSVLRTPSSIF
nr:hypothetical protein OG999_07755 [Streptomyces sp. NBC_00886]